MSDSTPSWCKVEYFIDAKDSMNDWCVALVTEINESNKTITVYHDGWGTRTTTYPFRSSKIAPFRKNTVKYTGPKRGALRDWEINENELNDFQSQVNKILASGLNIDDPFFITQFFRGKLYIYIENLLMCNYRINKKLLTPVVVFFGSVIKLIVMWLKKAPDLFQFFYKSVSHPDLYLEDSNTALALVWYELMDTLNKLFALDSRVSDFFQTYDKVPDDYEPSPLSLMTDKKYSETLMYMINLFTKEKGFEAVISILNERDEQKRVPFPFIATTLLYVLGQFFDKEFWNRFNQDLTASVLQRIDIISETELKDLKHEDIIRVLSMIKDNKENLEIKKLNFFLRMLKCNYFEKRIKGLSEINSVIESFDKKTDTGKLRISKEELKDWVLRNNLLELIINDRPHAELVKRSSVVFRFLAQNKALNPTHLELLWTSMQGKHDSYVRATHLSILDFTSYLSEDLHDFLYSKIKSVPIESYEESFLTLVKEFTHLALDITIRMALHNRRDNTKEFGLELFEKLLLDSCLVDFCKVSCKHIGSILSNPLAAKLRSSYMNKLMALVARNESVPQALSLLIRLFRGIKDPKRLVAEIKVLNEPQKLIEIVLNNLKLYLAIEKPDDVWDKIVVGRFSHGVNLRKRLKFIEFVVNKSGGNVKMTQMHLEEIWKILGSSSVVQEKNLFFMWITKGIKEKPPLDSENVEFLFRAIMNDEKFPSKSVTEESFAYFKHVFILFHANQNNIELQNSKFKFRKSRQLQGFDKLLQIQLNSAETSSDAAKFIISLLLRFSTSTLTSAASVLEDFTDTLLSFLLTNKNNEPLVSRGLTLIKQLLSFSESENFVPNSYVYVQESLTREFYKIHYDQNLNVRHLRREIAKHFKKAVESVTLVTNEQKFSAVDDESPLKAFKAHCINVEFKQAEYKEYNPLPSLSQNQKVIKSLFELLNSSEKSYLDLAWNLLVTLPINQNLEQSFEDFEEPLSRLTSQTNIYKLLYELMIVRKLSEGKKWRQKFLKNGGLEILLSIFQDEFASPIRQESLIRTLSLFLSENTVVHNIEKFVSVFFASLKEISKAPNEVKDLENFSKAVETVIRFLETCNLAVIKSFISSKPADLQDLFDSVLFSQNPGFNKKITEQLESLSNYSEIAEIFFFILYDLRSKALNHSNEHFWKLFSFILNNTQSCENERWVLISELVSFVSTTPCEKNSNNKNETLNGALTVLKSAWTKSSPILPSYKSLFLTKCLFEIPDSLEKTTTKPPVCKHQETRSQAFELLLKMCVGNEEFLNEVVKDLDKHHEEADWRGSRKTEWSISAVSKEKSQSGLVGLKNLGCTCYMNSMMQQIFMIQSFREGILATKTIVQEESLLYQLQYLFTALQYSDKQYINPKAFANTIKDYEGNPINLNEQMDVDEFFNYFMDKLESYLKDTPQKNLIKTHFGGLQVTELIGQDCPHRSERIEPFLTVSVEVKNKKSLQEGLESFVSGEMLEGENAYQCDHCEAKVRAVRRVCLKHLPNFLIIALRRFEFDFETMNRVKLNDFCEFPLEIDLEQYTQEGLDRAEKDKEKNLMSPKKFSDDYYCYKLRGIVIHAGTAESGHYYSYIQDKFKKWFEFNDVWVREFDTKDIQEECFGGEEKFSWSSVLNSSQNTGIREKCGNAYLLFYERVGIYAVRNADEEVLEPTSLTVNELEELDHMKLIRQQNKVYWRNKHIFAAEYSRFVNGLSTAEPMPFKFVFKFFLTIMLRTKEKREELISVYLAIEKELQKNSEICNWVLEVISVEGVCKELLLYCPMHLMRKIVVGLVKTAFQRVDKTVGEGVMIRLLKLLPLARKEYTKHFAQYHEVLKHSILASESLISPYKILEIVIKYLLNKPFKVPMSPDPLFKDIYLGYDSYIHPDIEKPDSFYTDSKSTTLGHMFSLLYTQHEKIPKKYKDLLRQPETIEDFLRQADNKLALKFMGKLYSELVYADTASYQSFIRKVIEYSHLQDFYKKSLINKVLTPLLLKQSQSSSDTIRFFLTWKMKQLRASKIYNDIETNINYLLTLCTRSKEFQHVFKDHSEIMSFIEKWVRENLTYGFTSKITTYEESRPALRTIYSKLQKISKNEEIFNSAYWDSDDEIEEEKLQKDKQIDVLDNESQYWVKGIIKQRIGDLLYMQIRGWNNTEYLTLKETYGEDIAPLGSHTRT